MLKFFSKWQVKVESPPLADLLQVSPAKGAIMQDIHFNHIKKED